jgi:hypothetical protein
MAGFLNEQYGVEDERREKIIKRLLLGLLIIVIGGAVLYGLFHNYPEEHQARQFFEKLEARDYQGAYTIWGCAQPCRDYPFNEFMKDWSAEASPVTGVDILDGETCGSGVIVQVDAGKAGEKKLWVERNSHSLGFPPFERCPQGNRLHDFWRNIRFRLRGRPIPAAGS